MKLLSSYFKEMKIAARGFYFYIEIVISVIILAILLFAINEKPISRNKEFIYYDMPQKVVDAMIEKDIKEGKSKLAEPTEFNMKAVEFEITNEDTGEITPYSFEKETLTLTTYENYNTKTGELDTTVYVAENEDNMIRLAYTEKKIGASIIMSDTGEFSYKYYIQGFETQRLRDLYLVIHNETPAVLEQAVDNQVVRKLDSVEILNNKQNMVPVFVVFMGTLMGFFIVMAYIFLDKTEGVIRAFAVTPSSVWKYLFSKTMIIMTTVILSSSIITIPVMGAQPNYLLFYLLLIISTFAFASLGLLVASFFDSISKSFGVLYLTMIALMVPAFSYFVPGFDPVWLRFFPTYPLLQGFKEILMVNTDVGYVLTYSAVFLASGLILFMLANLRFKKTLTV